VRLTQLRLHDFRSYSQVTIMPPDGVTVFVGENGAGKTNLLEAVHLCCLGKSHRTPFDRDMIRLNCKTSAVHAKVQRHLTRDEVGVRLYAQQSMRKTIFVNGKTVPRIGELMGHMTCVMFSPEDMAIIKGAPQVRRGFLDMLLSQCQPAYFYAIQTYHAALKQRNALLKTLAKAQGNPRQLEVWDEQLAKAAAPIVRMRQEAALILSDLSKAHYTFISGREPEVFVLRYQSSLSGPQDPGDMLMDQLAASREDDIRRLTTSVGPHRDDLRLMLSGQEMRGFASQGQMRTAVLAMRLAEINILTQAHRDAPLLLLDDVLSELDEGRRARLMGRLGSMQTLLTTTDLETLGGIKPDCVLQVRDGTVFSP
jgi:DNA replication and repair protein RecF